MDLKLKDKVVLVTGGTGGIGTAIVKGFLREGAKVAFSSTRQEKIDALLPTLEAEEGQVAGFVADLNNEEDIKNFVEGAKAHFGTIDVVVPNAGYEGKAHPVQDMTLDLFEKTYMLNVFAVMLTMKYAAPTLIEKGSGSVVVIASAAAYEPTAGNSAYVSSKYAVYKVRSNGTRTCRNPCKLCMPWSGRYTDDAENRKRFLRRYNDTRRSYGNARRHICYGQALC